jgi:hypothetical protein
VNSVTGPVLPMPDQQTASLAEQAKVALVEINP